MTSDDAIAQHERATASNAHLMWFVTVSALGQSGQAAAWAMIAYQQGCERLPGELVASSIGDLRAMLPPGLIRRDRKPIYAERGGAAVGLGVPPGLRSKLHADEHRQHVAYHERQAAEHDAHQELEAAAGHRRAAMEHEEASAVPFDAVVSGSAMRASARADEVSQRVRKQHRR